jgi:hypothetical protein
LHITDFANSEASLVQAIVDEIKKYPVTLGWGTTIITASSSTHARGGVAAEDDNGGGAA